MDLLRLPFFNDLSDEQQGNVIAAVLEFQCGKSDTV